MRPAGAGRAADTWQHPPGQASPAPAERHRRQRAPGHLRRGGGLSAPERAAHPARAPRRKRRRSPRPGRRPILPWCPAQGPGRRLLLRLRRLLAMSGAGRQRAAAPTGQRTPGSLSPGSCLPTPRPARLPVNATPRPGPPPPPWPGGGRGSEAAAAGGLPPAGRVSPAGPGPIVSRLNFPPRVGWPRSGRAGAPPAPAPSRRDAPRGRESVRYLREGEAGGRAGAAGQRAPRGEKRQPREGLELCAELRPQRYRLPPQRDDNVLCPRGKGLAFRQNKTPN